MQLVDSKLYIANMPAAQIAGRPAAAGHLCGFASQLKGSGRSARLLALLLAALFVATSPTLLNTVRSVLSVALQVLLEVGHAGLIAFQIFGR